MRDTTKAGKDKSYNDGRHVYAIMRRTLEGRGHPVKIGIDMYKWLYPRELVKSSLYLFGPFIVVEYRGKGGFT